MSKLFNAQSLMYSFPEAMAKDEQQLALAQTTAEEFETLFNDNNVITLYSRIDELDEELLDILAYDFKVEWYDYTYPIEAKRQTFKDSIKVHRQLGTKFAVETALNAVYMGSKLQEWFEYGGNPFMFRITIGIAAWGVTAEQQAEVLKRVRFYKNLRSHLEKISYEIKEDTKYYLAAGHSVGSRIEIYPFLTKSITATGKPYVAAVLKSSEKIEVYPYLTEKISSAGKSYTATVVRSANRLEIFPAPKQDN